MANLGNGESFATFNVRDMLRQSPPVTPPTVVVPLRTPQYGIPLAARQTFLTAQLPNGGPTYAALFSTMPDRAGVGGVEAAGSGYARVAHTAWVNSTLEGFVARRANVGAVTFATLTGDLTVVGWGIYDAPTAGNLLAFGLLRNVDGKAHVFSLASGDEPAFQDGQLILGIQ